MQVELTCTAVSAEAHDSATQMVAVFAPAIASLAAAQPDFAVTGGLSFGLYVFHPLSLGGHRRNRRGSYHKPTDTYYMPVCPDYARWIAPSWIDRTDAMADALKRAVAHIATTRLADTERTLLSELVEHARWRVRRSPPHALAKIPPVFVRLDPDTKHPTAICFDGTVPGGGLQDYVAVAPQDAASLLPFPKQAPAMFKLYRRENGLLRYHEGWVCDDLVVEHWGICGERGEERKQKIDANMPPLKFLQDLKQRVRKLGFRPIALSRYATLVIQYRDPETDEGLDFRYAAQDFINEKLGWLGLGHCDGGESGAGAMEIFCFVVNFPLAKSVLMRELASTDFGNYEKIYRYS